MDILLQLLTAHAFEVWLFGCAVFSIVGVYRTQHRATEALFAAREANADSRKALADVRQSFAAMDNAARLNANIMHRLDPSRILVKQELLQMNGVPPEHEAALLASFREAVNAPAPIGEPAPPEEPPRTNGGYRGNDLEMLLKRVEDLERRLAEKKTVDPFPTKLPSHGTPRS